MLSTNSIKYIIRFILLPFLFSAIYLIFSLCAKPPTTRIPDPKSSKKRPTKEEQAGGDKVEEDQIVGSSVRSESNLYDENGPRQKRLKNQNNKGNKHKTRRKIVKVIKVKKQDLTASATIETSLNEKDDETSVAAKTFSVGSAPSSPTGGGGPSTDSVSFVEARPVVYRPPDRAEEASGVSTLTKHGSATYTDTLSRTEASKLAQGGPRKQMNKKADDGLKASQMGNISDLAVEIMLGQQVKENNNE